MPTLTEYVILRRLEPGASVPNDVACYAVEARTHAHSADAAVRQTTSGIAAEKPTRILPVTARGWGEEFEVEPDPEPRWKVKRVSDEPKPKRKPRGEAAASATSQGPAAG